MIKDCGTCHYYNLPDYKEPCNSCTCFDGDEEVDPTNWVPKTNADRIREMQVEEFAVWLSHQAECFCVAKSADCVTYESTCKKAWLDWLRKAEDDSND